MRVFKVCILLNFIVQSSDANIIISVNKNFLQDVLTHNEASLMGNDHIRASKIFSKTDSLKNFDIINDKVSMDGIIKSVSYDSTDTYAYGLGSGGSIDDYFFGSIAVPEFTSGYLGAEMSGDCTNAEMNQALSSTVESQIISLVTVTDTYGSCTGKLPVNLSPNSILVAKIAAFDNYCGCVGDLTKVGRVEDHSKFLEIARSEIRENSAHYKASKLVEILNRVQKNDVKLALLAKSNIANETTPKNSCKITNQDKLNKKISNCFSNEILEELDKMKPFSEQSFNDKFSPKSSSAQNRLNVFSSQTDSEIRSHVNKYSNYYKLNKLGNSISEQRSSAHKEFKELFITPLLNGKKPDRTEDYLVRVKELSLKIPALNEIFQDHNYSLNSEAHEASLDFIYNDEAEQAERKVNLDDLAIWISTTVTKELISAIEEGKDINELSSDEFEDAIMSLYGDSLSDSINEECENSYEELELMCNSSVEESLLGDGNLSISEFHDLFNPGLLRKRPSIMLASAFCSMSESRLNDAYHDPEHSFTSSKSMLSVNKVFPGKKHRQRSNIARQKGTESLLSGADVGIVSGSAGTSNSSYADSSSAFEGMDTVLGDFQGNNRSNIVDSSAFSAQEMQKFVDSPIVPEETIVNAQSKISSKIVQAQEDLSDVESKPIKTQADNEIISSLRSEINALKTQAETFKEMQGLRQQVADLQKSEKKGSDAVVESEVPEASRRDQSFYSPSHSNAGNSSNFQSQSSIQAIGSGSNIASGSLGGASLPSTMTSATVGSKNGGPSLSASNSSASSTFDVPKFNDQIRAAIASGVPYFVDPESGKKFVYEIVDGEFVVSEASDSNLDSEFYGPELPGAQKGRSIASLDIELEEGPQQPLLDKTESDASGQSSFYEGFINEFQ